MTVPQSGSLAGTTARAYTDRMEPCTDIIATNGGILKFCQTERTVDVFESGVDPRERAGQVSLVDDPRVLSALQDELSLRPELAPSRRIVSRSCVVRDRRYLTISMESLKRILRTNDTRIVAQADRPVFEPVATGSIGRAQAPDPAARSNLPDVWAGDDGMMR